MDTYRHQIYLRTRKVTFSMWVYQQIFRQVCPDNPDVVEFSIVIFGNYNYAALPKGKPKIRLDLICQYSDRSICNIGTYPNYQTP